jgi:hypothetical protein
LLKILPGTTQAYFSRGYAKLYLGDFVGALADFKKAEPITSSGDPTDLILDAEHLISPKKKKSHETVLKLLNNAPFGIKEELIAAITKTCNLDADFAQMSLN